MAKWSSDWLLLPLPPHKTLSKALLSISIPHFLSITTSSSLYRRFIIINSSKSPSPVLQDPSNAQFIQLLSSPSNPEPIISNKFIQGLCKNPDTESVAFNHYQKARAHPQFKPTRKTLDHLIDTLLKSQQWCSISALSDDFRVFDVFPGRSICTQLIRSCILAQRFKLAESLLQVLEKNTVVAVPAFGEAMRSYNKLHMYSSTVLVFDKMTKAGLSPDSGCYFWAMDAYRKQGNTEKVLSLFIDFESNNIPSSGFNARIYSVLCDSLGRSGRAFEALRYFREMVAKGITPSPSFYASLIGSFAGTKEAEIAEDLFQEARGKGMVRNPDVFSKLVLMYVEVGLVEKTIGVVEAMREIGVEVTDCILSAIVNGFGKNKGLRASVMAYNQLISQGCEPGQVTYASIINIYCNLGLPDKAEALFEEMLAKGFNRCLVAYSNMISMYGKIGRAKDAMRLLAKMKEKRCEPNVWVYNSLLEMNGRLADLRRVEKLWKEMKRRKIQPDRISYTSIINAYSKAKEFEECVMFYQEFRMNGGKVDQTLAGIMVGVFSKSSKIEELLKLLRDMKAEGTGMDARLYKSALNALRDAGLQVQVQWFEESYGF